MKIRNESAGWAFLSRCVVALTLFLTAQFAYATPNIVNRFDFYGCYNGGSTASALVNIPSGQEISGVSASGGVSVSYTIEWVSAGEPPLNPLGFLSAEEENHYTVSVSNPSTGETLSQLSGNSDVTLFMPGTHPWDQTYNGNPARTAAGRDRHSLGFQSVTSGASQVLIEVTCTNLLSNFLMYGMGPGNLHQAISNHVTVNVKTIAVR